MTLTCCHTDALLLHLSAPTTTRSPRQMSPPSRPKQGKGRRQSLLRARTPSIRPSATCLRFRLTRQGRHLLTKRLPSNRQGSPGMSVLLSVLREPPFPSQPCPSAAFPLPRLLAPRRQAPSPPAPAPRRPAPSRRAPSRRTPAPSRQAPSRRA